MTNHEDAQRVRARDLIATHLQLPTGGAHEQVRQLTDDEVKEIVAAADAKDPRHVVKDVITRAYDRRRTEAAAEAQRKLAAVGLKPGEAIVDPRDLAAIEILNKKRVKPRKTKKPHPPSADAAGNMENAPET